MLSPTRQRGGWRFYLSVDTLGLYVATTRMAIASGERGVPFELFREDEVMAALRGEDKVEVGPFYGQLSMGELLERRADGARHVAWDPPPRISPAQRA